MVATTVSFDWSEELHQLLVKNLVTSFGLDFLLLEDKKGGDVDTTHNVRQGIWATEVEKNRYEQRGDYNSVDYHKHPDYIARGRADKLQQYNDQLEDNYTKTGNLGHNNPRDLDHTISAKEIHNDAARVLAGIKGEHLANQDANLNSTHSGINRTKQDKSVEDFLNTLPNTIASREQKLSNLQAKLDTMPQTNSKDQHDYRELEATIKQKQDSLEQLKDVDPDEMRALDKKARDQYDSQINLTYYTSTKFFASTLSSATSAGFRMGLRESLGLILAELWFELRSEIPLVLSKYKSKSTSVVALLDDFKRVFLQVVERIKKRFKDILSTFKDSFIGGFFASITSTILNAFLTTTKLWGKIIRESWSNLVKIIKLAFFNPDNLSLGQLNKACFKIVALSTGVIIGSVLHSVLASSLAFPFGAEINSFISAFVGGVITLGLNYFLDSSPSMQKLWAFLDTVKSKHEKLLDYYKAINQELDAYLVNLSAIEFNFDANEIALFVNSLADTNSELERNIMLTKQLEQRDIKIPFEMGKQKSLEDWVLKLCDD